jgi:ribose transport system substrate-binding protein
MTGSALLRMAVAIALSIPVFTVAAHGQQGDADRLRGMVEPTKAKKPYKIGLALVHYIDSFWIGMTYGMLDEAEKSGVVIQRILVAGGYGQVREQIAQLESLATQDLDAVILGAVSYEGLDRTIKRLTDKGITVVALAVPIKSAHVKLGVIQDEFAVGKIGAKYICDIKPGALVLTIPGPQGAEWNRMRFEGFKKEAATCNLRLVGNSFSGNMAIDDGITQASDLMVKYGNADFIWTVGGNVGDGAAIAVKRANRNLPVIGAGFTARTVEMMKEGIIKMYVSEPANLFGRAAIQYTVRSLNGEALPNMMEGILPYPVVMVPNVPVHANEISGYDLTKYDQAPANFRPPASR